MHLEYESGQHRTEFVNGHRIVTFHQHMPTPLADSYYEEFNLEIGGGLPLTEHLKYPLLGILVLRRRTLRAFEPANHVLHRHPPNCVGPRNDCCLDGLTNEYADRHIPLMQTAKFQAFSQCFADLSTPSTAQSRHDMPICIVPL